ncbi:hypothetical protein [Krasilnikovia sp. M28-CT-15]|uniref:hypothetical protein n=1 Tax=Krasilnikovia sp. M28-CT-15 TaxID=3373540 RepID=UPI00399D3993
MDPPLADCRQPRAIDAELAAASGSGQAVVVSQVVTGLGGVGKTQVAAAWAHRCWQDSADEAVAGTDPPLIPGQIHRGTLAHLDQYRELPPRLGTSVGE